MAILAGGAEIGPAYFSLGGMRWAIRFDCGGGRFDVSILGRLGRLYEGREDVGYTEDDLSSGL